VKNLKHSVMIGFFGAQSDRFHRYQEPRSLEDRLDLARSVRGAEGIEVVYPNDFHSVDESARLIRQSGLPVSAVNLNVKGAAKWRGGSFTSRDAKVRADAVADLRLAMDLAHELGAGIVTCCPLIDGHNYAFEADYLKQWHWLCECIATGAEHRPEVRISLEYKLNESRNYILLGDMGRALYLCERLGLPNVGVTLDLGHALLAKETPAEALCLAAQAGRLFYVHFNDNGREWDWDMLPGSVNLWDLIETVYYLDRLQWQGWLSYDVLTRNGDPVETFETAIDIVHSAHALLDKLGRERIQSFIDEGIPARAFAYLIKGLL